jgi:hypothetical protein
MVQAQLGLNDFCPHLIRSSDNGHTWNSERPIWPSLIERYSIFGSISSSPDGALYFFGTHAPIHAPGEANWCEATQGIKANELIWARSDDFGHTWSEPELISSPIPGAAEAPGPMCITKDGTWHACYAPYNTFDPEVVVPRNQVVLMSSADQGRSWRATSMLRFSEQWSTGAEAWVVELADHRLLATCWNINQSDGSDFPNAYAISEDGGHTWSPTRSTGIFGQSTALTPLCDGSALFTYCKRRSGKVGVWLANIRPTDVDFGIQSNEIVWEAPQRPPSVAHADWTHFTFGEPSATVLEDGTVLVFFWHLTGGAGSIQCVRIKSASPFC